MQGLLHFIFAALLAFGLVACNEEKHADMSPLVSGVMHYKSKEAGSIEKELSAEQLQKLDTWLYKYRNDWSGCYITPPQHRFLVFLKHANGQFSYVRLLKFDNSNSTLMATHLLGSNKGDQPCAFLTVSEQEISNLQAILALERLHD